MDDNYNIKCLKLFKEAEHQRELLHHEYVGTEHLLLAILKEEPLMKNYGLEYESFYQEIKNTLSPTRQKIIINTYTPLLKKVIYETMKEQVIDAMHFFYHILDEGEGVAIRILLGMGIDIDSLYQEIKNSLNFNHDLKIYQTGKLLNNTISLKERVVGRDKEINLLMETLLRKKKNNPLLVGDAGVGKTALVEELTRRIIKGDVPDKLLDTKIVSIELGSLVAGTKYRGEFEEKLNKIIEELLHHQNIILFIDEIHALASAGAAEGAISASDILKPYLARGDIKCIGATTKEEYEKYFAKDKALARRFEMILLDEPNEEETFMIMKAIKEEYRTFHKVDIKDELIKSLIHLTNIYFPNKYNPDKSIELLDSVMSYVKLKNQNDYIKEKEKELKNIELLKIKEVENGHFKEALKSNILENKLRKQIINYKNNKCVQITSEDIMDVLENKNNLVLKKRVIKIDNQKYNKRIIRVFNDTLKTPGVKSFYLLNPPDTIGEDIASTLHYNLFKLSNEKLINKMYSVIKYHPSTVILLKEDISYPVIDIINKIYKDHLLEYNEEYLNFSNVIILVIASHKKVGFNGHTTSNIPYDEIIEFKNNSSNKKYA